ncbi:MAG: hypothetical protein GEU91_02820 [Rhizobiales bacterium]|nr:hypothetical protein [Hyphomicrobiales bacterium]
MDDHWLTRDTTVRRLWIAFVVILAVLVLLDVTRHEAHFTLEAIFGFGAWFGFLSCVALIVFAKALGVFLKRPDTYYDS